MNEIALWAVAVRAVVNCVGLAVFSSELCNRPMPWWGGRPAPLWWGPLVRGLAFALLCVLMVAVRLGRLLFLADFVVVVALCTLWIMAVKRTTLRNALYGAIAVFLCLDLTVAIVNAAYRDLPTFSTPLWGVVMEMLYAVLMLGVCYLMRRWAPRSYEPSVSPQSFVVLLLALAPYLLMRASDVFYDAGGRAGRTMDLVLILAIVATFGAFVGNRANAVAAAEKVRRLKLEMELQEHQRRFKVRKETIDEINRRYHDMVRYARTCSPEALDDYLESRMTGDLPAVVLKDTGNDTLDMLLWEVAERCAAVGVRLVPVVDIGDLGSLPGFDLHAMVGNALDNAIEAASRVGAAQEREVRLGVRQVNRMLFVSVRNPFAGELRRDGDRLLSTKDSADGAPHGYGVDNIRRTVERYGGSLSFDVQDNQFDLRIMVPLP